MKTGDKSNSLPRSVTPQAVPVGPTNDQNRGVDGGANDVTSASGTSATGAAGEITTNVAAASTFSASAQTPSRHLGLDRVDALWDAGNFTGVVDKLTAELSPLQGKLKTLDGASVGRWISELHVLQHRGISLANKISMGENPAAAKKSLSLLQTIANLQTEVFERTVFLADAKTPDKAVPAWIVHKDTMKKSGFHSPDARQQYFIEKARGFIEKGGDLSSIKSVTADALSEYKSGQFVEWVVDSNDVARITDSSGSVSPGHTLLAWGGDALSAGTLRLIKDDDGKITQAIVGTFSGHFRSGKETLHHMARHLVAAGVPPEAIVLQGGEAGSARALEVLRRAMGTDGATSQREQAELDAAAQRYNPFAPSVETTTGEPTRQESRLYDAMFVMRLAFDSAFDDGIIHGRPDANFSEVEKLANSIDHALTAAEIAESPVAFKQVLSILEDLIDIKQPVRGIGTSLHFKSMLTKWKNHKFGSGAIHAGALLSEAPVADRVTRVVVQISSHTSVKQIRSMLAAGADVFHLDAKTPGAQSLMNTVRNEAGKLGRNVSLQVDVGDGKDGRLRALARDFGDLVVVDVPNLKTLHDLKLVFDKEGLGHPVIARMGTADAVTQGVRIAFHADGLLVDRSALAKIFGAENVPLKEKFLHELGNRFGKATIVNTEVFPSMADSSRGTRAEVEGAYRAVSDLRADALMLDEKTLNTDDPGNVVSFAGRVAERAEVDRRDRPYAELKERGVGPSERLGQTHVAPASSSTANNQTPVNEAGETDGTRSPARQDAFERLLGRELDALETKGDDVAMVKVFTRAITRIRPQDIRLMDGEKLAGVVGELHILQHRLIGVANRISTQTDKKAAMKALSLLQPLADLQTVAFNRSVAIDKAKNPSEPVAWIAHVDTMKKPGYSAPLSRLAYFAAKADKFIQRGGNLDDIKTVAKDAISDVKSGVLQEFVVDTYDQARFYDATKDVTPGHTLAAYGEDVLTAGTLRIYKDDDGVVKQAVIGTFSGHYRAGQESLHHMARHLIAAGIPEDRIVLQGGEAGGARALEVLHMATGLDGADAQRELDDTNARAQRYNPFTFQEPSTLQEPSTVQEPFSSQEPIKSPELDGKTASSGADVDVSDVVTIGVISKADAQALLEATARMNQESVALLDKPQPISGAKDFVDAINTVLDASERLGNPIAFGNAIGLLRHWASLAEPVVDAAAENLFLSNLDRAQKRDFGNNALDPANMIGPRPVQDRRARIVATVNPEGTEASYSKMIAAGMNVARYNPAHATPQQLRDSMSRVRAAATKLGKEVAIQIDLTGPKIRLGKFANPENKKFNDIFLKAGETVTLTSGDVLGDEKTFPIDIDTIDDIMAGHRVFMNDGTVELIVKSVGKDANGKPKLVADVMVGGKVWDKKGVNLPDSVLTEETITEDDKKTLDAVLDLVDTVAVSFVRHPSDILRAREEMRKRGKIVPIIAKIERPEALDHLDKIAAVSDGMMVARGDLGVEIGPENVPAAERRIAKLGNSLGRPVMVATEVFSSMSAETSQTKAETEGLFSAIAGLGVDAIMLGKETSFPDHPETTVRAANQVIEAAETTLLNQHKKTKTVFGRPRRTTLLDLRMERL